MPRKIWGPDTADLPELPLFAAFDTEDDGEGNLYFGGVVTERGECFRFETPGEFMGIVEHLGPQYCLWAHNLEYDAGNVLTPWLDKCRPIVGGHAKVIGINMRRGPTFRDSFLHWFCSLKDLGDTIGLEKLDADFDDPKVKAAFAAGEPWTWEYCKRDCEIVLAAMIAARDFYAETNTRCRATVGGCALSRFERNFLTIEQPLPPWLDFIREAYYGGRTESFSRGPIDSVHSADINAAYAAAMRDYEFPDTRYPQDVRRFDLDWEGVCRATVDVPDMPIPPLPCRTKAGNIYGVGRLKGYWAAPELRHAAAMGCRVKTGPGLRFRKTWRPFQAMVNYHYPLKAKAKAAGNKPLADFHKRSVNSLYGMFGLAGERWHYTLNKKAGEPCIHWGRGFLVMRKTTAPFANQIWSTYITSFVRITLHRAMLRVLNAGGRVHYCDTDSVYYSGPQIWGDTADLGELNHDGTAAAYFVAPKTYMFGDVIRAKGIPKPTLAIIKGIGAATLKTPRRLMQALKAGDAPNIWAQTTREVTGTFTRRQDCQDGTTRPLRLSM
jgi:hypothetical protein